MTWLESAFIKLARLGAIVFLPTADGKFLFQQEEQGLRPPGGGKETEDKTLTETILREIKEEFGIPKSTIKKKVRFLGYEHRRKFWGNAVYELRGHNLKPGLYQASNSPDEKIRLVKADLDDPRYVGPRPDKLITEAAKDIGSKMLKQAKTNEPMLVFPMENRAQFPAEDQEALLNIWLDIEDELHGRKLAARNQRIAEDWTAHTEAPVKPKVNPPPGKKKMEKEGDQDSVFGQTQAWQELPAKSAKQETVGFDLDGTLAKHDSSKPFDPDHIGEKIKSTWRLARLYLRRGHKVIIFTARAEDPKNIPAIEKWLVDNGLEGCRITNKKTPDIDLIFDDKATGVEKNTGKLDKPVSVKQACSPEREQAQNYEQELYRIHRACLEESCTEEAEQDEGFGKCARIEDIPNYTARRAKVDPQVLDWIENYNVVPRENSFHPSNLLTPEEWSGFKDRCTARQAEQAEEEFLPASENEDFSEKTASALNAIPTQSPEETGAPQPNPAEGIGIPEVPAGPPKTGPGAICHALQTLDLNAKETEAKDILHRKLKSKRDGAVKLLGIIDGLRRTGVRPHDLMISRVPVIPPVFRPFTAAGDVFIPGDANELYRDLINMRDVNQQIGQTFGKAAQQKHHLQVYDAAKALYGFGEPTSPKTKERSVSGFLKKVTGSGPKWSFAMRKMLSKPQDYVGRSVVAVEPSYDMNQIGIPHDMAWTLYAPYIQRRLVRGGMKMEEAVRHVRDRSEHADNALNLEMKERPVIYSRSPAWHKFSIVSGWPKRVEGNAIMVNPFVATGMNMDYDGDTVNVHTPAFHESVEDAKNKLMPDKMLFSIKKRNDAMAGLKQEQILGAYQAQHRPAKQVHQFKSRAEALKAIQSGKVPMSDEVEFP